MKINLSSRILAATWCLIVQARAQTEGGQLTVLRNFTEAIDGAAPQRLISGSDGRIYGVNNVGGSLNGGTVFRLATDGGSFTVLRHFSAGDGMHPLAIIQSRDGRLYGVAEGGSGSAAREMVFAMNLDGSGFAVIHRFGAIENGWSPRMLIEGSDGRIYGTCLGAGITNGAEPEAIFRVNRDGTGYALLRTLNRATEGGSDASIIQGVDGRLYGNTRAGGANGHGSLFRLNTDGSGFTVLRQMSAAEGRRPFRLLMSSGGILFGAAEVGGTRDTGTLFRLNSDGTNFVVIHNFIGTFPPSTGTYPSAGLTQGRDGMLYGATSGGGLFREGGTLFRLDPVTGNVTFLHAFDWPDGVYPRTELVQGQDGRLYGNTGFGGSLSRGTVFAYSLIAVGSATTAATVGERFSHPIVATAGAVSYFALGLPAGLSVDSATGIISGTPLQAGVFPVTVGANIVGGSASATLNLTVAKGAANIQFSSVPYVYDGTPQAVRITTSPAGLSVSVIYNGATTPPTNPGTYNLVVTVIDANYSGSANGAMTIVAAPVIASQTTDATVVAGNVANLSVVATGGAPLTYQWQHRPVGAAAFANITDETGFAGATTAQLSITSPTAAMNGDEFRVIVANAVRTTTGEAIRLVVHPGSVLRNVSVRASVTAGSPLTVGFVTTGARPVLIRAIGPGLTPFLGSGTTVAGDPSLVLMNAARVSLATNDNWRGATELAAAFSDAGAFPLPANSQDAAILSVVNGAATTLMTVTSTGLALIEVYDAGNGNAVRVANLSALHHVGRGADALVAGFNISGTGTKALLVRGIGPSLRSFGVTEALSAARLEIFSAGGASLAATDSWLARLAETFARAGAFALPPGSRDAALMLNLPPGSYTVQLSSADTASGDGLIEIYELP